MCVGVKVLGRLTAVVAGQGVNQEDHINNRNYGRAIGQSFKGLGRVGRCVHQYPNKFLRLSDAPQPCLLFQWLSDQRVRGRD